jgi:UDP-glucose 4-epimerase
VPDDLVLVTGAAGFIGSNLVARLLADGHRVIGVDDLSSGRLANLAPARAAAHGRFQFDTLDVTSAGFTALVERMRPTTIVHLAAQVDVRVSVEQPLEDARLNLLGTLQVLEAARRSGVRRVVYAASIAGYGDPPADQLPITEQVTTPAISPYGVSKRAGGDYVLAYGATHGLEGVVLTLANVYGPHQSTAGEGGVVAIFAGRMLDGAPCTIFGDGEQTRDFVFIDDVVDAFARAATVPGAAGERMLVGTGVSTTVNELFAHCAEASGYVLPPVHGPERAGEVRHSVVDASLAQAVLGWTPWTSVADGVRATIAWASEAGTA